ncbi:MAG: hypothetical protein HKN41_09025 [Ilumatobacter sp.]|nr:hypothetical protein [Ilumatobacter sp.]
MNDPRRRTADTGTVLPLVLILVVVLGLVAGAIASYTATALRTSDVTVRTVDRIAAAETGAAFALQSTATSDACSTYTGTVNQSAVSTTCEYQRRAVNADGLYALVITDLGIGGYPEFNTQVCANPNCTRRISGPVYLEAGINIDLSETQAVFPGGSPLFSGGNVSFNLPSGDCGDATAEPLRLSILSQWDTVDELNGNADVTPFVLCDARGWSLVAPTPDTTGLVLPDPITELVTSTVYSTPFGDCEIFEPGYLGTDLTVATDAFFKSGVYHIDDADIVLEETGGNNPEMTVGTRTDAPYAPAAISQACDDALTTNGIVDDASGAVWVMSGSSNVEFDKTESVDFYPRDLGAVGTDLDISMLAMHVGPLPTSTLDPASDPLIDRQNPTQTKFTFHGQVYAPGGWVRTGNSSSAAEIKFLGGLVLARLDLQSAANVAGINISVPVDTFDYFLIESTAVREGDTTVRVVAFDDGSATGLQVESWRVCERIGC